MDAFEITKTINQIYGIPDNILTTCLQSCQIPCTILYGLESVVCCCCRVFFFIGVLCGFFFFF